MKRMTYFIAAAFAVMLGVILAFASPAQAATARRAGTWGTCPWEITDGALVVHPGEGKGMSPWKQYASEITSVVFVEENGKKVVAPASCNSLFAHMDRATSIDLSGLDTSRVTSMKLMFWDCTSLTELDVSGLDTSNVTTMERAFDSCTSLVELDLSGWDTSSLENTELMFFDCRSLRTIDFTGWNTKYVTTMYGMFNNCTALTELDLSSFNTRRVVDMGAMFAECGSLKTIRVCGRWTTRSVVRSSYMFYGCTSLVGRNGTRFDPAHTDARYAQIDIDGFPGYLTA